MRHDDYMNAIATSTPDDWTRVEAQLPLLHDIAITDTAAGRVEVQRVSSVNAYKPNLAIAVGVGARCVEDFQEPWATGFPDTHAHSFWVLFFFNGMPIDNDIYVSVDGGRCVLPIPRSGTNQVSAREHAIARILNSTSGATYDYDDYFRRAGLTIAPP
jgi:hypothetical protein